MSIEKKQQIQYLLLQYLDGVATDNEESLLFSLLEQEPNNKEWEPLIEELIAAEPELSEYRREEWQPIIQTILKQGTSKVIDINNNRRKLWQRIAVAASIILVLGFGVAALVGVFTNKKGDSIVANNKPNDVKAPETTKATITLADGRIVTLDSATSGTIATQGNVKVIKNKNGEIVYDGSQLTTPNSPLTFNTLSNPRGSKVIDMTLSDGSHVWLNAGSSVTYPVAFIGNQRKVSITGEAYFEISHDKTKPFIVSKGNMNVQVLGTHFNVNAYDDESEIKVTLLEGSVKVSNNGQAVTIKPGEQARITSNIKPQTSNGIDLDQVMAWKNNRFIFSGNDIKSVMRQLARWYDVEVKYEGTIPTDEFVGVISRSRYENISAILSMLEKTKTVSFKVDGRTVTVMQTK